MSIFPDIPTDGAAMTNPLDNIRLHTYSMPDGKRGFTPKPKEGSGREARQTRKPEKVAPKPKREGISPRLRALILERDGYKCVLCGRKAMMNVMLHIGHEIPVCQGGTNDESNLRTECSDCNLGGGARRRPTPKESIPADRIVKQLASLIGKKKAHG